MNENETNAKNLPGRAITTHCCAGLNEEIVIYVQDAPGPGGAPHRYATRSRRLLESEKQPHELPLVEAAALLQMYNDIHFQQGPLQEAGCNGISNEALLAIVRDRLECFQAGDYACQENENALNHLIMAMEWLMVRTQKRLARGVEGTSAK